MRLTGFVVAFAVGLAACGSEPPLAEESIENSPETPATPSTEPSSTTEPPPVETSPAHVEGHRGARGLRPESTLAAFETALDIGVDVLELDLHRLSDGEIVIWHDDAFGNDKCRYTDDSDFPPQGLAVASLTTSDLSLLSCDVNPDPARFPDQDNGPTPLAGGEYHPVTLAELFEFVATYATSPEKSQEQSDRALAIEYDIETKRNPDNPEGIGDDFDGVNPGEFELETLSAIDSAGLTDRVVIQSFDHRSLWAIRSVNPNTRLSALTFDQPDLAEYAEHGASIWSPDFRTLTPGLVEEAHSLDLLVHPWTVNTEADMIRILAMGVDGFITDRPDIAADLN